MKKMEQELSGVEYQLKVIEEASRREYQRRKWEVAEREKAITAMLRKERRESQRKKST